MPILFLLLAIPAAEIYLFIEIGGHIGVWPTIGLIFGTAIIGGALLRIQGIRTLANARREIEANRTPVKELAHGAALGLAAMMLLTPGFITDAIGALLILPPVRYLAIRAVLKRIAAHRDRAEAAAARARAGDAIDGEYEVVDDEDTPKPRPKLPHEQ